MARRQVTEDSLFAGRLHCLQHADGYRFSVDAVLLSHFVRPREGARILDLGAGCGVISLLLCFRLPSVRVIALELQPGLVNLINENIQRNHYQERISLIQGDLRHIRSLLDPEMFDLVVCNPPYGKMASGRRNPGEEQSIARHELEADLADIVTAISYAVKNRGRAALIYPAERAAVLLAALKGQRLEPKRLQVVHSYPDSDGKLVLVEAMKNGGEGVQILSPFYVYREPGGEMTPEMAALYEE